MGKSLLKEMLVVAVCVTALLSTFACTCSRPAPEDPKEVPRAPDDATEADADDLSA